MKIAEAVQLVGGVLWMSEPYRKKCQITVQMSLQNITSCFLPKVWLDVRPPIDKNGRKMTELIEGNEDLYHWERCIEDVPPGSLSEIYKSGDSGNPNLLIGARIPLSLKIALPMAKGIDQRQIGDVSCSPAKKPKPAKPRGK
jgi:hypothetical protein